MVCLMFVYLIVFPLVLKIKNVIIRFVLDYLVLSVLTFVLLTFQLVRFMLFWSLNSEFKLALYPLAFLWE